MTDPSLQVTGCDQALEQLSRRHAWRASVGIAGGGRLYYCSWVQSLRPRASGRIRRKVAIPIVATRRAALRVPDPSPLSPPRRTNSQTRREQ